MKRFTGLAIGIVVLAGSLATAQAPVTGNMMLLAREINTKLPEAVGKSADATTRPGCLR